MKIRYPSHVQRFKMSCWEIASCWIDTLENCMSTAEEIVYTPTALAVRMGRTILGVG